jgi:hypothetical protein
MSETVTRRDHAERVREYYREQGARAEQKRIIKVLEETVNVYLLDKLLVEAAVIVNVTNFIKGDN